MSVAHYRGLKKRTLGRPSAGLGAFTIGLVERIFGFVGEGRWLRDAADESRPVSNSGPRNLEVWVPLQTSSSDANAQADCLGGRFFSVVQIGLPRIPAGSTRRGKTSVVCRSSPFEFEFVPLLFVSEWNP